MMRVHLTGIPREPQQCDQHLRGTPFEDVFLWPCLKLQDVAFAREKL